MGILDYCYDADDIAYYCLCKGMGTRKQTEFVERLFEDENEFLHPRYKTDKKQLLADVLYYADYMSDFEGENKEFDVIGRDFAALGKKLNSKRLIPDCWEYNVYIKTLRLRLRYDTVENGIKQKLGTVLLLNKSKNPEADQNILDNICRCLIYLHIRTCRQGGTECDLRDMDRNDVVFFEIY